ncbi:MAG: HRDC domain-containing protein [Bacteroidota bacterium]
MIDTPDALAALVDRMLAAEAVAIDTEFVWDRTYYPRLGLIQIGLGRGDTYLLDAPALDLAPLGRVLADLSVTVVLHDAVQDLTILHRATGGLPVNVFDTQRIAGLVGLTATASLTDLVEDLVGVEMPATQARTDWLRRPLSPKQQTYALADVEYLLDVKDRLEELVVAKGRQAIADEERATYDDPALYTEETPEEVADRLSFKGQGRLRPRQRVTLDALAAWREEEARYQDTPRRRVVSDDALVQIAQRNPRRSNLLGVRALDDRDRDRYGDALREAVEYAHSLPDDALPPPTPPHRDDPAERSQAYLLNALVVGRGTAEDLDPILLTTKSGIGALVEAGPDADPADYPVLQGWRREIVGADLLRVLRGEAAVQLDANGLPSRCIRAEQLAAGE